MARKSGTAPRKAHRRPRPRPPRGALTQAIPTDRERLHSFFNLLRIEAARLLPEHPASEGGMPGLTDAEIEMLRARFAALPEQLQVLDALDALLAHEPDAAGLLYPTLRWFVLLAHFIGSHTHLSEVQRLAFERYSRSYMGARSAFVRMPPPPPMWHETARELARKARAANPRLSKSAVATRVAHSWPRGIRRPAPETLRKFLRDDGA
jgi:hypothetical protein